MSRMCPVGCSEESERSYCLSEINKDKQRGLFQTLLEDSRGGTVREPGGPSKAHPADDSTIFQLPRLDLCQSPLEGPWPPG